MPLPQLGKSRGDFAGKIKSFMRVRVSPAKGMEKDLETKTRNVLAILAQHVHEICCHQYDGSDGNGNPIIGEIHFSECTAEPCVEINHQLKVMTIG